MIKSIYVSPLQIEGLGESGANHFIISSDGLNSKNWQKIQKLGLQCGIAIDMLKKSEDRCPLDPEIQTRLFTSIDNILKFGPAEVWIDRLRFGGDCTGIHNQDVELTHRTCKYCKSKDRQDSLFKLVKKVKQKVAGKSKFGLFTVAFEKEKAPNLALSLGLDYEHLGQLVDIFSPMLYHRMIGKSTGYISDYVKYLHEKTGKPIIPAIQIKDMPDDLEDKMDEEEITQAFYRAIKEPSKGVCFFCWQHALERNKTGVIKKLFS